MVGDQPPGVKSNRTLLAIIECVYQGDGVSLTEIAANVGMAKSTVYDHLVSLRDAGLLRREGNLYHLGLMFLKYGIEAQHRSPLYQAGYPKLRDLVDTVNERTWCFVEEQQRAVYLCGAAPKNPFKTSFKVGDYTHLHHLAGGKAILAYLPQDYIEEIIENWGLPALSESTITNREELFEELAQIRDRGIAYNNQESMDGLRAIGAPVRRVDLESNPVVGSVSISGPANRLTDQRIESKLRDALLGTVNEIELNMRDVE